MDNRSMVLLSASLMLAAVLAGCQPAETPEAGATDAETPIATDAPVRPDGPGPGPTPAPEAAALDADVPRLRIATLDGTQYDLAAHRGKWVVVNFWATWCAPCLKEMPELSALDAMHEHIEVIGLAYEDIEVESMRDFLAAHPVVYPIAIVDTYDPPADFDTPRGLPMTYLIAPDGTVAQQVVGPVTAREIEDAIAAAGGPAADAGSNEGGSNETGTDDAGAAQPS